MATLPREVMTENGLKQAVLRVAYANGWAVFHMTASNIRGSQGRGYPDLTLARDRKVLWIELKAEKGLLSDDQHIWADALPAMHVIRPRDWHSGRVHELLA